MDSETSLQQNPPVVISWRCLLTHVDLHVAVNTVVVVVVVVVTAQFVL